MPISKNTGLIDRLAAVLLVILFALPLQVQALGVTPGRVEVDFVPGADFETKACFTAYSNTRIRIEPIGFMVGHIELYGVGEDGIFDTRTNDGCISYKVTLPETVEKPGVQYGGLSATEIPETEGGNIYAIVKIIHQIFVKVPYPGKYLEITGFSIENSPAGSAVPISLTLENKGEQAVIGATGEIIIYDKDNKTIGKVSAGRIENLQKGQIWQVHATWNSSAYTAGNYRAKAAVIYDGLSTNATTEFKLGGLDLNLAGYSNEVIIGGIKPFSVSVDSIWSEVIEGVKARVSVYGNTPERELLESFETLTVTVPPWATQTLNGYIDTQKMGLGLFNAIIDLQFAGQAKQYNVTVSIIEPPKAAPEKKSWSKILLSTTTLLSALAIVLVIILAIVIFIILPRKKKEDKGNEKQQP